MFVYLLPLSDMEDRVNKFGEKFPKMYEIPLKFVCPTFALFLAGVSIFNEFNHEPTSDSFSALVISYIIMALPTVLLITFSIWNPFGKTKSYKPVEENSSKV